MLGAYGFGQGYFGQGPLESVFHQPIAAEPLTLRAIASQVALPLDFTGDQGTVRHTTNGVPSFGESRGGAAGVRRKTSGRSSLADIKRSH